MTRPDRTKCKWCGARVRLPFLRRTFCSEACVQAWTEHDKAERLAAVQRDLAVWAAAQWETKL